MEYKRLTSDSLPGVRRNWKEVVAELRAHPEEWYVVEEGATLNRASSVRQSLRYHGGIKASQRLDPDSGTYTIFAKAQAAA